jgi:hypothetical protein
MQFLYPSFLWALGVILIPIIVHLFNLRRYKKLMFSNVKFLKEIQQQTRKNRNIRQLLILLSRIFAFAALVFLFAQPFIQDKNTEIKTGKKLITLYIDNSFSMAAESESGPLLAVAKTKSNEILKAFSETDVFQIVTNDFKSSSSRFLSKLDAQAIIDDIQLSPKSKDLSEIILKIQESEGSDKYEIRNAFLLSDFQNHALSSTNTRDTTVNYSAIRLESERFNNLSIDSVWFENPILKTNEPINAFAKISNRGPEDLESISLKLFVNGEQKLIQTLDIKASSASEVSINFALKEGGWKSAQLVIEDHPIQFDDQLFFAFNVRQSVAIMEIFEEHSNPFLKKLYDQDDYFRMESHSKNRLDYGMVSHYDLVILNELNDISSGLNNVLLDFLEGGGSLVIIPSENSNTTLKSREGTPFYKIAAELGSNTDVISFQDKSNLLQNIFETIPQNIDLPKVVKSYKISSDQVFYNPILTMSNQAAFLAEIRLNAGRIFVQAVPLNQEWSNFQQHALFVPLYLKMAFAGTAEYPYNYTIGENEFVQISNTDYRKEASYKIKNNDLELTPEMLVANNRVLLNEGNQIVDQNFYNVFQNDSMVQKIAFNYSRNESIPSNFTQAELESDLQQLQIKFYDQDSNNLERSLVKKRDGTQLWQWFALLSLFFIAIEILLLRFWPKA